MKITMQSKITIERMNLDTLFSSKKFATVFLIK
jgi:hypothetical protein